ncbi:Cytochrome P450 [Nonomuraea solani]|uniref:Cytochrome P450 n=1 Tax=Nonomuraea solani TaxID=1144553 RepID=A0A1H6ET14_9ACTN|nr:cytochrome P450 [Nonomuraea solani]SEH00543.1 Cytochrome P450 [Nonomuraea solani]
MSDAAPVTMPTLRQAPFDPPEELAKWREEAPIRRLRYADDHLGWLVTGYAAARAVLGDNRFSSRPELHHPTTPQIGRHMALRRPPAFFVRMDPPEHTRYRKLLTGQFTVRRMNLLEPRIAEITTATLDAMLRTGPPAELVRDFALPIPALVICELLGVPYDDRDHFQQRASIIVSLEASTEQKQQAMNDVNVYVRDLVADKRAHPGDDLISGLSAGGELTEEELAGVSMLLLLAGHETTANMLAQGTFTLLTSPAQLAALRGDPALVPGAVEELLRYLTVLDFTARTALEDVELDGHAIKAGDTVTISLPAANRDPRRFTDPAVMDITREAVGHLTFGHGIHQCLGQQLARNEMRIALPALLTALPGLRLAVPADEVPMRSDMLVYGVHRLPVTW